MNPETKRLYELVPALYRVGDTEQGEPLKALLAVIAEQLAILRESVEQLYDDQFIETCADWVAPYIGDLIGYRLLHGVTAKTRSARAEVANTIAYRRRKGTATVLEQLARDVTGWNARAVEFFLSLAATQYMNHIRPFNHYAPDLRHWEPLERLDTAFNTIAHTVDVRRIDSQKGQYNIPDVGLFLWRLDAYRLRASPAVRVDDQRFLFCPLGHNLRLFTRPETEEEISHLAEPTNVPEPISRRVLDAYLDKYYGEGLSLFVEAAGVNTAISNVQVCDLSDFNTGWAHMPVAKVSIDPVLGRIAFPAPVPQNVLVRVTFHYGFSGPMGGGEYERRATFAIDAPPNQTVSQGQSLQTALGAVAGGGAVEIGDSGRYNETPTVTVNAGARIELRAANEHRPTLVLGGDLNVDLGPGSELALNGLLMTGGQLSILAGTAAGPRTLRLRHCTLVPGLTLTRQGEPESSDASLVVEQPDTTVEIDHSIVGAIRTVPGVTVRITNSIVDATSDTRVAFAAVVDDTSPAGRLTVENATIVGKVNATRLDLASNTIFVARLAESDGWVHPVHSEQNQQGCIRFSFVPEGSVVPRRYRCQPDLAVAEAIKVAERAQGSLSDAQERAIAAGVRARVRPAFTTLRYGEHAYAQLAAFSPLEIRTGADDESELGAFHDVFAPQRETNLRIRLEEYLRFGLEAGVFYAKQE